MQGAMSEEGHFGMQMMNKKQEKPHAVCIPFPAQGHINPMLMIAKLLHHQGFHITFVNTIYNHNRLIKSNGTSFLESLPDFTFEKINDGLDTTDTDCTQDVLSLCESILENFVTPFRELIVKLNDISLNSRSEVPPVTCIVSDMSMSFTSSVAKEFGVPIALLLTSGACGFASAAYYQQLVVRGFFPVKDESFLANGYLDTTIDFIPGMRGIRLKDLFTFFRTAKQDDGIVKFTLQMLKNALEASIIVGNTFDALEHEILEGLPAPLKVCPIGPLHLFVDRISRSSPLQSLSSHLWKNEPECISWLGLREPKSVLYLNFGSIAVMTPEQSIEFAWGLAKSEKSFLWVIRPDMLASGEVIIPAEFVEETKGRGLLAGWCPQEQVLNHPSVGGFLTHCGWNSTLEGICAGIPLICWPFLADQQTNCWFACNNVGTGVELSNDVKRNEVEKLVRELMDGDKGKEMYKKAAEWKSLAEEAVSPSGHSSRNFEKLVNEVLLSKSHSQTVTK